MRTAEDKIVSVLKASGPLPGWELAERTRFDLFTLWRFCRSSPRLYPRIIGRRFLRLDRTVDGYARLSPSIGREFTTYTVVGTAENSERVEAAARVREEEIAAISREKFGLAQETIASVLGSLPERAEIIERSCFILAGDIVYSMSHRAPRPERSTGKPVRGSDIDIVIVTEDEIDPAAVAALDRAIYDRKHLLLVHPRYREELDYLIKDLSRVRRQLKFDSFERMVGVKILHEGEFLAGSPRVFGAVKEMLAGAGMPEKIAALTERARRNRRRAEESLLQLTSELEAGEYRDLFRTREESLEGLY